MSHRTHHRWPGLLLALALLTGLMAGTPASPALANHPCSSGPGNGNAPPPPSFSQGDDDDRFGIGLGDHACRDGDPGDPAPPPPPSRYVVVLEGDPACWRAAAIGPNDPRYDNAMTSYQDARDAGEFIYGDLLPWIDAFVTAITTGQPMDLDAADVIPECDAISPEVIAFLAWRDQITLPRPATILQPDGGTAIAGKATYLMVGDYQPAWDADTNPRTVTWVGGPVRIIATAEHRVDWGDGTVTPSDGWYDTNGRRWMATPPADAPQPIRHVYEHSTDGDDTVTITVTTRWTARWELLDGSGGGPVPFFRYSDSPTQLNIDQVQAVIVDQS